MEDASHYCELMGGYCAIDTDPSAFTQVSLHYHWMRRAVETLINYRQIVYFVLIITPDRIVEIVLFRNQSNCLVCVIP